MSKRILSTLISILMVLVLLPGIANAKGNGKGNGNNGHQYGRTVEEQYKGGAKRVKLEVKAAKAQGKEFAKLEKMVDKANKKVEQLVKKAQKTPQNDVEWLLNEVDKVVGEVFAYAKRIGATVVCEYTEYCVDGQYVLIDPIRIIRL